MWTLAKLVFNAPPWGFPFRRGRFPRPAAALYVLFFEAWYLKMVWDEGFAWGCAASALKLSRVFASVGEFG
jgi:hypothetical protein